METLTIINTVGIIIAIGLFCFDLIIKNYLPSYISAKAENLATKEDIQEITRKTEEVQQEFRENLEVFASDMHFKYDYYYKQYCELYSNLYGVIIQSEYVRYFLKLSDDMDISFDEAPFIEIQKRERINTSITQLSPNVKATVNTTTELIKTPLSEFNKLHLYEQIISKSEYATPQLLKLAVSYRYAHSYYSGNEEQSHYSNEETANEEEFRLIRLLVCCIVTEYNFLRKELKMDYNSEELKTGKILL